jgi:hypothetical protein
VTSRNGRPLRVVSRSFSLCVLRVSARDFFFVSRRGAEDAEERSLRGLRNLRELWFCPGFFSVSPCLCGEYCLPEPQGTSACRGGERQLRTEAFQLGNHRRSQTGAVQGNAETPTFSRGAGPQIAPRRCGRRPAWWRGTIPGWGRCFGGQPAFVDGLRRSGWRSPVGARRGRRSETCGGRRRRKCGERNRTRHIAGIEAPARRRCRSGQDRGRCCTAPVVSRIARGRRKAGGRRRECRRRAGE